MTINILEIEDFISNAQLKNETKEVIEIFLAAINDWPDQVKTFEFYEEALKNFIHSEPTESNLNQSLQQINLAKHSWQAESISQILEVFKFYPNNFSLHEIISDIKKDMKIS